MNFFVFDSLQQLVASGVWVLTNMGCIQSGQKSSRKNGEVYHYNNGETWLNRPKEGYHWEQQRSYERHLNDGTGCEYVVGGMAGVGMTGMGLADGMGDGMGAGCDGGGDGGACGAGGCGGCGAC